MRLANVMSVDKGAAMPGRHFESRLALAMLPTGAAMTLVATGGAIAAIVLAAMLLWNRPTGFGWWLAWSAMAAVASGYAIRKGIETMSTFDWRVAVPPLLVGIATALTCPSWWL